MADNLGVTPIPFSSDDEGVSYPAMAQVLVAEAAEIDINDTYIVWFAYTMGNWKALVSTKTADGKYYEVTTNKDKNETYVDVYVKVEQHVWEMTEPV